MLLDEALIPADITHFDILNRTRIVTNAMRQDYGAKHFNHSADYEQEIVNMVQRTKMVSSIKSFLD